MKITVEDLAESRAAVRPQGRLDLVSAPQLRAAVDQVVQTGSPRVIVDLAEVTFIDSTGLGALIAGLRRARQAGGELRIAAPTEQPRTVLDLTKLARILRPYRTLDEALQGL